MTTIQKSSVLVAWLATLIVGSAFLFGTWTAREQKERASISTGLFIAVMSAVCTAGTLAYASQTVERDELPAFDKYWPALKPTLIQQAIILTLTGLMLDGGGSFHVAMAGAAGFWPMVLIIVVRRPDSPRKSDLFAIRYGFPIVWLGMGVVGGIVWSRIGLL